MATQGVDHRLPLKGAVGKGEGVVDLKKAQMKSENEILPGYHVRMRGEEGLCSHSVVGGASLAHKSGQSLDCCWEEGYYHVD